MSILKTLEDERIFRTKLSEDKQKLRFRESCFDHFALELNKDDLRELIAELTGIWKQMEDVSGIPVHEEGPTSG